MEISFGPAESAFRQEVCTFLRAEWKPPSAHVKLPTAVRADDEETYELEREMRRKLGRRGWLALGWPKEYGGQGRSVLEQYLFNWEMSYHGVPSSNTATGIVGPTLLRYGTEWQKQELIPRIASGEIEFCLGYTEPNAGSDLASLSLRAVRDGDEYVLNGQKVFTSGAHRAEYVWLAARTDPEAPKHRGISLFIVDLKSPGVTVRELKTLGDHRTNEVFYEDVRVPMTHLVGEENRGWYYMTTALDHERVNIYPVAGQIASMQILVDLIEAHGPPRDPVFLDRLSWLVTKLEALRLLSLRNAWLISTGGALSIEASVLKVFSSELQCEIADAGAEAFGLLGTASPATPGQGWGPQMFEQFDRWAAMPRFAGGSNEIMKNIIATRGLGLPRG